MVTILTQNEAVNKLNECRKDGHMFSVKFFKRTDGRLRQLTGRFGVTKGVNGRGTMTVADDLRNDTVRVFDMNKKAFRQVNLRGLHWLKVNGQEFNVLPNEARAVTVISFGRL